MSRLSLCASRARRQRACETFADPRLLAEEIQWRPAPGPATMRHRDGRSVALASLDQMVAIDPAESAPGETTMAFSAAVDLIVSREGGDLTRVLRGCAEFVRVVPLGRGRFRLTLGTYCQPVRARLVAVTALYNYLLAHPDWQPDEPADSARDH